MQTRPGCLELVGDDINSQKSGTLTFLSNEFDGLIDVLANKEAKHVLMSGESTINNTPIKNILADRIKSFTASDPSYALGNVFGLVLTDLGEDKLEVTRSVEELTSFFSDKPNSVIYIEDAWPILDLDPYRGRYENIIAAFAPLLETGNFHIIGNVTKLQWEKALKLDGGQLKNFHIHKPKARPVGDTLEVLATLKADLEQKHGIQIAPSALGASINLSGRYIPNKSYPDKAVKVLEDACNRYKAKAVAQERLSPEMLNSQSLMNFGTRVGSYDVMKTVEETQKVDIRGEAKELYQAYAEKLNDALPGQDIAIRPLANAAVNNLLGLYNPFIPAGVTIVCGPGGFDKLKTSTAILKQFGVSSDAVSFFDLRNYVDDESKAKLLNPELDSSESMIAAVKKAEKTGVVFNFSQPFDADLINTLGKVMQTGHIEQPGTRSIRCNHTQFIFTVSCKDMAYTQYEKNKSLQMLIQKYLKPVADVSTSIILLR